MTRTARELVVEQIVDVLVPYAKGDNLAVSAARDQAEHILEAMGMSRESVAGRVRFATPWIEV